MDGSLNVVANALHTPLPPTPCVHSLFSDGGVAGSFIQGALMSVLPSWLSLLVILLLLVLLESLLALCTQCISTYTITG